jgi:hypothetical protein
VRARSAAALVLVCLVAPVGCGSDSDDSGDSGDSGDLASKSPEQVVEDAAAALRRVKSFHAEGTQGRGSSATTGKADVSLPEGLRVSLQQGQGSASMRIVGGALYIKANEAFWGRQGGVGKNAGELAGRWLKAPLALGQDLVDELDPTRLSRCLLKTHGTLARGGTATVDGQRAVVVIDKGDRPGTAPGKLFVAASGPPLPLRTLTTGRERPGGRKDPQCDGGTPSQAGDEAKFSDYNEPLDIKAPPNAIDLAEAAGETPS